MSHSKHFKLVSNSKGTKLAFIEVFVSILIMYKKYNGNKYHQKWIADMTTFIIKVSSSPTTIFFSFYVYKIYEF